MEQSALQKEKESGESERMKELRKAILSIQKDTSLTPMQKAKKIQALMSGKPEPKQEEEQRTSLIKTPEDKLDKTITYHKEDSKILGCKHYQRGCKIRAACCGQLFGCRWCHDEAIQDHHIDRHATEEMFCMHCSTLQPMQQTCAHCKKEMGRYYCDVCKFVDDAPNKEIYHCPHCGICRVGKGLDVDFFHCMKCNTCLGIALKDNHKCIENSMKSDCPVCNKDLFTSTESTQFLPCGHAIHSKCLKQYLRGGHFKCAYCSKSVADMSSMWRTLDELIRIQPMPSEFENTTASILCNDCNKQCKIKFHFIGHKCSECGSYNTKILSTSGMPLFTPQMQQQMMESAQASLDAQQSSETPANAQFEEAEDMDDSDESEAEEGAEEEGEEEQNQH